MIDGATLGTLLIGLDSIRASAGRRDPPIRPVGRVRRRAAAALRFLADRVDRRPAGSSPLASPAAALPLSSVGAIRGQPLLPVVSDSPFRHPTRNQGSP